MASSSSSKRIHRPFSGIEPPGIRREVSESTRLYDVFINHRGPDSKETLAKMLYDSLKELGIRAFLDSEEKELGQSFPSIIETAISSAAVHIAIFSKRYAESSWCLAELVLMLHSPAKIIPVFYDVKPWELRYIEKGVYAGAFIDYEKNFRHLKKLDEWKKALELISYTAGHEIKDLNFSDCKSIVTAVQEEVQRKEPLHVAENPVALDKLVQDFERRCLDKLVHDFETHCGMNKEEESKAKTVGVYGMGGVGKTTLCKELYNRMRHQYHRVCFLYDVREASARSNLISLQGRLLKDVFGEEERSFQSTQEGSNYIRNCIARCRPCSFLIVLDDIDHQEQLDALPITHMPGNSLVIITTRDEGILITKGIDVRYHLQEMDKEDARHLFSLHAFSYPHPASGYGHLVDKFVGACGGLPLSLQVLGRHVRGRNQDYWRSVLKKLDDGKLHPDIKKKLQISFDALENEEKQMFIDMACFFVDQVKSIAMTVWEASGWDAQYGLQTLKDRCLVEEIDDSVPVLRMHDHLRDLGREMANDPGQPPRLWRPKELKTLESKGFEIILNQTKRRCFHSFFDESLNSSITFLLGESDDTSISLLLLQLDVNVDGYSSDAILSWIPLQNMQYFTINGGRFNRLWQQGVQAPSQLRVLEISEQCNMASLVISGNHCPNLQSLELSCMENLIEVKFSNCEDFEGLNCVKISDCGDLKRLLVTSDLTELEELSISECSRLEEASLVRLGNMKRITISDCNLKSVPGISSLGKLIELNISRCPMLKCLSLAQVGCLEKVKIESCCNLKSVTGISDLRKLVELNISLCWKLQLQLRLVGLNFLRTITVDSSLKINSFELDGCRNLETVSGENIDFRQIQMLDISACPDLRKLPVICGASCLERITLRGCVKLSNLELMDCRIVKRLSGNFDLAKLSIKNCPMLEELPCFGNSTHLKEIHILRCEKLQKITLPLTLKRLELNACGELKSLSGISALKELVELNIIACPELPELDVAHLSLLEKLRVANLKKLSGISNLTKLVELEIYECRELELELCLSGMTCLKYIAIIESEKMQTITLPSSVTQLILEACVELKKAGGISGLTELVELNIKNSPELQGDLHFSGSNCLYSITVEYCNIHNMTLPVTLRELKVQKCRNLQGIAELEDLTELTELYISECPELEEIPSLARANHFERIKIVSCDKLQNITLSTTLIKLTVQRCIHLQRIAGMSDLEEVIELCISDCPELEELPVIRGLGCLEKITIDGWGKYSYLHVSDCNNLKEVCGNIAQLRIWDCPELEEFPCFAHLTCLEEIHIIRCPKLKIMTLPTTLKFLHWDACLGLQSLSEISHLNNLVELIISQCWQPELELHLEGMNSLQSIRIDRCGKLKSFLLKKCQNLNRVSGNFDVESISVFDCPELEELRISDRPELEELTNLSVIKCLESINIISCERLRIITLPTTLLKLEVLRCGELQRVEGIDDAIKLEYINISDCPNFEELPSIARLSCLKSISINSCLKLKNIAGIEDLQALEEIQILFCSYAAIQDCARKLMSVSSAFIQVVGKPADGAELNLNPSLFFEADFCADVAALHSRLHFSKGLSAIIVCGVVEDLKFCFDSTEYLLHSYNQRSFEYHRYYVTQFDQRPGEWIMTTVITDQNIMVRWLNWLKKWCAWVVRDGEDWRTLPALTTIVDKLYQKQEPTFSHLVGRNK